MNKKKYIIFLVSLMYINLFSFENEYEKNIFDTILFDEEFPASFDSIEKLNNTFWISKNPFSDQQLQSIGYITSNTPGFIFIADNTVLIVNIQAYLSFLDDENNNIEYDITSIDGIYKLKPLADDHYKTSIYELWLENNILKVKYISENQTMAKDYVIKQTFWNELKIDNQK